MAQHVPPGGVWCPAATFFNPETDELDLGSQATYYSYLSRTGLAGLVILGTNAEAFLLTREERKALIATAHMAVGPEFPIMAGCGAHSTKQVLELIGDAADAGANSVLVLPPAYFGKATTPEVIERFYADVSKGSKLPIIIYNFSGVSKITRLAAALPNFATFGGQSDFIIGGLSSGSVGCIAAFANVAPKTIVRIYDLYRGGKHQEALELHKKAALGEQFIKAGIGATKYAAAIRTATSAGIPDPVTKLQPRTPYVAPTDSAKEAIRKTAPRRSQGLRIAYLSDLNRGCDLEIR
ncbi:dihydrodipicolinate synthetase [Annulohypoxylon bovei var. microspora]|nr:dihydrodipicolinate synthetase [Annulohypoxylon bovei var. microspora]